MSSGRSRGQRFEKTEDRETERSVFRPLPGAKRRKLIRLLSSQNSVLWNVSRPCDGVLSCRVLRKVPEGTKMFLFFLPRAIRDRGFQRT
ncbi:MAG: hypothetical protein LBD06_12425 [Candidatus Accumulibacter sp.]|nr:hypothetical protein [Accumulibacter sp.]